MNGTGRRDFDEPSKSKYDDEKSRLLSDYPDPLNRNSSSSSGSKNIASSSNKSKNSASADRGHNYSRSATYNNGQQQQGPSPLSRHTSIADIDSRDNAATTDSSRNSNQNFLQPFATKCCKILHSSFELPNLFWIEKILLIVDFLQIFGIIWNAANSWPWPYLWIIWTRFINYANIDIFSMMNGGALAGQSMNLAISKWGSVEGYGYYALWFAIPMFILSISTYIAEYCWFSAYGKRNDLYRSLFVSVVLLIMYLLYMPVGLAVIRLYPCDLGLGDSGMRAAADRSLSCYGTEHTLFVSVCTILAAPAFFILPYVFYKYTSDFMTYKNRVDHEKRLQSHEIAYHLGINTAYIDQQLWITASFERDGAFFRTELLVLKGTLLVIYAFVRENLGFQAFLMWIAILIFCFKYMIYHEKRPYRSDVTDFQLLLVFILWICNITLGLFNAEGMTNVITISSNETLILLTVNGLGCLIVIGTSIMQFYNPVNFPSYPPLMTLRRMRKSSLARFISKWTKQLKASKDIRFQFASTAPEVADVLALEDCIRILRSNWLYARAKGSIFCILIGDELERLLVLHSSRVKYTLRSKEYWNDAYLIAHEKGVFSSRNRQYILLSQKKRKILFKLLVLKVFLDLPSMKVKSENPDVANEEDTSNDEIFKQLNELVNNTSKIIKDDSGKKEFQMNEEEVIAEIALLQHFRSSWGDMIGYFDKNVDILAHYSTYNGRIASELKSSSITSVDDMYTYLHEISTLIQKFSSWKTEETDDENNNDDNNVFANDKSSNGADFEGRLGSDFWGQNNADVYDDDFRNWKQNLNISSSVPPWHTDSNVDINDLDGVGGDVFANNNAEIALTATVTTANGSVKHNDNDNNDAVIQILQSSEEDMWGHMAGTDDDDDRKFDDDSEEEEEDVSGNKNKTAFASDPVNNSSNSNRYNNTRASSNAVDMERELFDATGGDNIDFKRYAETIQYRDDISAVNNSEVESPKPAAISSSSKSSQPALPPGRSPLSKGIIDRNVGPDYAASTSDATHEV